MAVKSVFDGFVLEKSKALSLSHCAEIVERMDKTLDPETGVLQGDNWFYSEGDQQFKQGSLGRDDQQIYLPNYSPLSDVFDLISLCAIKGLNDYCEQFPALRDVIFSNVVVKLQKTRKGGGYSVWHYERGNRDPQRCLAWMIYLNDVSDGGETEFLLQHKRVSPKAGTLLIWPADFTHVHRGNPPLSSTKYIATGWFNYSNHHQEDWNFDQEGGNA